ncbi:MAG TPA: FMN-binding protein [Thermomicrobiales bacterium]|jgi:uncharacterized protein with FMN-binding domain
MLDRLKKIALSSSVVVLFALYAFQEKNRSPLGVSTVDSAYVATATPRDAAALSTVKPAATSTATIEPARVSTAAKTVTPTAHRPAATSSATSSLPTRTATAEPTATSPANGEYADGTYTGSVADANWGDVEVQAVVTNGNLSDVQFLTYPDHRSRSRSINERAMPVLIQEAIQSQRADVDVVTGATDTSEAFIQSLAAALQQAAP